MNFFVVQDAPANILAFARREISADWVAIGFSMHRTEAVVADAPQVIRYSATRAKRPTGHLRLSSLFHVGRRRGGRGSRPFSHRSTNGDLLLFFTFLLVGGAEFFSLNYAPPQHGP